MLVNSIVDFAVVLTCKKKQQKKRHFSRLNVSAIDFMVRESNHEILIESRAKITVNAINSAPVDSLQGNVQTLEKSNIGRVRSEVDSSIITVETTVHGAILSARERLKIPRVE